MLMNQFEIARLKAEKRMERERPVLTLPKKEEEPPREPKPKAPKKKSNEIEIQVWVNDTAIDFAFKANITGNLMPSQINQVYLREVFKSALSKVLGTVE